MKKLKKFLKIMKLYRGWKNGEKIVIKEIIEEGEDFVILYTSTGTRETSLTIVSKKIFFDEDPHSPFSENRVPKINDVYIINKIGYPVLEKFF